MDTESSHEDDAKIMQNILDLVPCMISIYNIHTGVYIFVSRGIKKILGYTARDFQQGGMAFATSLVHPDDLPRIMKENAHALTLANSARSRDKIDQSYVSFEYRMKHRDGTWRWLHTDGSVFSRTHQGKVESVLNVSIDITPQKRVEEKITTLSARLEKQFQKRTQELHHSEERFRYLVQHSSDSIALLDVNTKITYQAPSIHHILGYESKTFEGKRFLRAFSIHPQDKKHITLFLQQVKNENSIYHRLQFRIKHADGSYKYIEALGLNRLNNPLIHAIILHLHDITDYKQTLTALEDIKYALDQSAIVAVTDTKGVITYVNDKFTELSRYSRKELIGKTHRLINSGYHSKEVIRDLWNTIQSGKVWQGELRNRKKTGAFYWVDTTITPLLDEHQRPKQFIAIRYDITRRKELERQKDEFIGIASHELKTPVTSIKGYTQIMKKRFTQRDDHASTVLLQKMDFQINKLSSLISDLLDVTKIESGKLQFNFSTFNIFPLIAETVTMMQMTTDNHEIKIQRSIMARIEGDRDRLGQVLINLISNAIKYSPHSRTVLIHPARHARYIQICVEDFGNGIAPEKQALVFERFYRVDGAGHDTVSGMGLGLYISAEIIKRHKGTIWVESTQGKGSRFCFRIPIKQ